MAGVALGLYTLYVLAAFGLRSLVHWRKTGSTGFHGLGGTTGSAEWWGGVLFTLALLCGLVAPVLQLAGILNPISAVDDPYPHGVGLALAVLGIAATLAAQDSMGRSWRVGVDHAETTTLVTSGGFALVRNPVFTAMITTATGLTLRPQPTGGHRAGGTGTGDRNPGPRREEPYLLATHGHTYRDYAARVGHFLPGLGLAVRGSAR